jgi:hypothetical protein
MKTLICNPNTQIRTFTYISYYSEDTACGPGNRNSTRHTTDRDEIVWLEWSNRRSATVHDPQPTAYRAALIVFGVRAL